MTHPLHRAYINDHVDEWRLTDLKAVAPTASLKTSADWAAMGNTPAMQKLAQQIFKTNAQRRSNREQSK